jgi:hypothetical protein
VFSDKLLLNFLVATVRYIGTVGADLHMLR